MRSRPPAPRSPGSSSPCPAPRTRAPCPTTTRTASDGSYAFGGLRPGTYTITETQPAGYADDVDTAGTLGGTLGNDVVRDVPVRGADAGTGYDFLERGASVAGLVYEDLDDDGVRDGGEPALEGVTLTLTGAGSPDRTTTTDANGAWSFSGLPAGTYAVTETQPTGYLDGRETRGDAGGTLAPPDTVSGIALGDGQVAAGYLFGEQRTTSLAGRVQVRDGVPLPGVRVTLTGTTDRGVAASSTVTTGADGTFAFPGLEPGRYELREQQPDGYGPGSVAVGDGGGTAAQPDRVTLIDLDPGERATGYVFTDPAGALAGSVYEDLNGNGTRDPLEPGLPGTRAVLRAAGVADRSTTTGLDGGYLFRDLPAGLYTLLETQPDGFLDGVDAAGSTGGVLSSARQHHRHRSRAGGGRQRLPVRRGPPRRAARVGLPRRGHAPGRRHGDADRTRRHRPLVARTTTTAVDGTYAFPGLRRAQPAPSPRTGRQ